MGEAEKVERRCLAVWMRATLALGAEVDEARLVRMEREPVPIKPLSQHFQNPFGVVVALERHHEVISKPHQGTWSRHAGLRFRRPRFTPSVRVSPRRSRKVGGLSQARALGQPAPQFSGSLLRGHGWALSGLQAIHPVPLLRSWTPVESACPRHSGHVDAAPAIRTTRASALVDFEADSRSFGTCSPTLRATIAVTRKAGFRLADWPLPGGS